MNSSFNFGDDVPMINREIQRFSDFEEAKNYIANMSYGIDELLKQRFKLSKDFKEKLAPNLLDFIDNKELRVS